MFEYISCFPDSCELTEPVPANPANSFGSGDRGNDVEADRRCPVWPPMKSEPEELLLPGPTPWLALPCIEPGGVSPDDPPPPL